MVLYKELITELNYSFSDLIDCCSDSKELKLINSCNGDLSTLLDNLENYEEIFGKEFKK